MIGAPEQAVRGGQQGVREQLGLSAAKLAQRVGVGEAHLRDVENARSKANRGLLYWIAEASHVPLATVIEA